MLCPNDNLTDTMNAILNQKKHNALRSFIPLNSVSATQVEEICSDVEIESCEKGTVLFDAGDSVGEFVYLLSGMNSLYVDAKEVETVVTGSEVARFAIAHQSPRKVKAVAKSRVRIARIATAKLDAVKTKRDDMPTVVGAVEDQLLIAKRENEALLKKVNGLGREVSQPQQTDSRVSDLERELKKATTALLDIEIQLVGASTVSDAIDKEDSSELSAIKSELGVIREQTESDIKAMQTKLDNSERMNLSLKKKILSMQAVASQEIEKSMAADQKKSWWK